MQSGDLKRRVQHVAGNNGSSTNYTEGLYTLNTWHSLTEYVGLVCPDAETGVCSYLRHQVFSTKNLNAREHKM